MIYWVEQLIMVAIIIVQLVITIGVLNSISSLRKIFSEFILVYNGRVDKAHLAAGEDVLEKILFSEEDADNESLLKIAIVGTEGQNETILQIKDTINDYLINNYGAAVNFSMIKDIVDREIDVKDESVSLSIPIPLYFGLAATMTGIILGLMAMPDLNGEQFAGGIKVLVDGVKVAMGASLVGLVCTTILSYKYKVAKREVLHAKNRQISHLQVKLLPELIKAEDTGVSGLKASLDTFAREATQITNIVKVAAIQTGKNIDSQMQVMCKLEKIDMMKVSTINLELFNRLEKSVVALDRFASFLSTVSQISDNLKDFASRTSNVDTVIKQIDHSLQESQKLQLFLSAHFSKIESAGNAALKAVDLSDSLFSEALRKLTEETNKRIAALSANADSNESKLKEVYAEIGQKLDTITAKHIETFAATYANAVPQFQELDHLKLLPQMHKLFGDYTSAKATEADSSGVKLLESLESLITQLKKLDNRVIISTLQSIEGKLNGSGKPTYVMAVNGEYGGGKAARRKPGRLKRIVNVLLFRNKNNR